MMYPKRIITRVAATVLIIAVAASLTFIGLRTYKHSHTSPSQPAVVLTASQRLRQKGIDEITSGNTTAGITDLNSAIKLLDATKDGPAIAELKQQIDYAQLEPNTTQDTVSHTIDASKEPNAIKR